MSASTTQNVTDSLQQPKSKISSLYLHITDWRKVAPYIIDSDIYPVYDIGVKITTEG